MVANRSAMSPYLRVAEDIRSRIARGEIAVGDRAPTTREVAKQWKVAMATAARALGVLADQGVIRVVPRPVTAFEAGKTLFQRIDRLTACRSVDCDDPSRIGRRRRIILAPAAAGFTAVTQLPAGTGA